MAYAEVLTADSANFFADLPQARTKRETFDDRLYQPAPDDWGVVVTDVEGSADELARGRHMEVNFVAACAISALKNLCAPLPIPFLFNGDGSVIMVPGAFVADARRCLARVRGFVARRFELSLRVGLASVGDIRQCGADVLVCSYVPSPGNSFGVFGGGGVAHLQAAVRDGRAPDLARRADVPASLDDGEPIDVGNLSSRWQPLESMRGRMVTFTLQGRGDLAMVYGEIVRLATTEGDCSAVKPDMLKGSWPPKGLMTEAKARSRKGRLPLTALRLLAETAFAHWAVTRKKPIGTFDPARYLQETATNTGFCKFDDILTFVLDCPTGQIGAIQAYLDEQVAAGTLRYGMHASKTALMTCLVTSPTESLHVHFIDGGEGGFTNAGKSLRAAAR